MVIHSKKLIAVIVLLFGLIVFLWYFYQTYTQIQLTISGIKTTGIISGFRANGAFGKHKVSRSYSRSKLIFGARRPYFKYLVNENESFETLSQVPQLVTFFNYNLNQEVTVSYQIKHPNQAVIVSWKEFPGLIFMECFGILAIIIGRKMLFKKEL